MKFFNSLTSEKEKFIPINENEVSLYVCGPTVYDTPHIGNMRPVIVFDCLKKFLEYLGYNVKYISNITDVDDKIINKALENSLTEKEISEKFIKIFLKNLQDIGSDIPTIMPKVTENMDSIISFIDNLVKNDYAYEVNGNVYFSVEKISDYGKLSNQSIEALVSGARIEVQIEKKSPLDFTLWKKTNIGKKWESPWSLGRPGWHTECVAIIDKYFEETIDIHAGGLDLKFPHHENELAQYQAYKNKPLANYWLHNGRLLMNSLKMSKSLKNIVKVDEFIEKYNAEALRFLMLSTHYRQPLNYTESVATAAYERYNSLLRTWCATYYRLEFLKRYSIVDIKEVGKYKIQFEQALKDDLNTPNAISVIYEIEKELNKLLKIREWNDEQIIKSFSLLATFEIFLNILGFEHKFNKPTKEDFKMLTDWKEAKANKNYEKADEIRDIMNKKGIPLM